MKQKKNSNTGRAGVAVDALVRSIFYESGGVIVPPNEKGEYGYRMNRNNIVVGFPTEIEAMENYFDHCGGPIASALLQRLKGLFKEVIIPWREQAAKAEQRGDDECREILDNCCDDLELFISANVSDDRRMSPKGDHE